MNFINLNTFDALESLGRDSNNALQWPHIFMSPLWMRVWWDHFGRAKGYERYLGAVMDGDQILGAAPLMIKDGTAELIGGEDVCDYGDLIAAPGHESVFCRFLLDHLHSQGVVALDLKSLRPDSVAMRVLAKEARRQEMETTCEPMEVTSELTLPDDWDAYLMQLSGKQRHEVRRKLRRLDEAGEIDLRVVRDADELPEALDCFFNLFGSNREDKAGFMTPAMERYFRSLAAAMADAGLLKLYFLNINGHPASAAMCFEYGDVVYLYNSGYDRKYQRLSAGLICKVLSIKASIGAQKTIYDFLKGAESYKKRLGGRQLNLHCCRIKL